MKLERSVDMKRMVISILTAALLIVSMASCGQKQDSGSSDDNTCEVAMIAEDRKTDDTSFTQTAWKSVEGFADENEMTAKLYKPDDASEEAYLSAVEKAADDGAGMIVMAGSSFAQTAYSAQTAYPDTDFLLIDGVPHDDSSNYATAGNTVSVIFAEEEAGYMAGYAAVKDGYTKLGFIGGQSLPEIKRYGYGFVQGAAAAAAETETKVEIDYRYAGESEGSDEVQKLAEQWYDGGTEVIFACGGSVSLSVIKAAEKAEGKVIGADFDQSALSEAVITSACKDTDTAVKKVLRSYEDGTFAGGTAFNYAARNNGVSLEMKNSRFRTFSEADYKKLFSQLKNEKVELKKDTAVKSVSELAGEWVTLRE